MIADIDLLQRERDDLLDTSQRLQADFENYRKRVLREQTALVERATEGLVEQLLPVLDSFELALANLDAATLDADRVRKGIELVYAELLGVLERAGLERIDALGAPFDPNEHEAVMQDDGDGEPRRRRRAAHRLEVEGTRAASRDGEGCEVTHLAAQREWFEKDYYAVLGVPSTASEKELSRAYKKLAKQHHPDANAGNAKSEERFKEVNAAYEVLGDAEKRKEYDEVRRMVASGVGPGGFGGGGGPGGFGAGGQGFQFDVDFGQGRGGGISDLLGNLLGNRGGRDAPRPRRARSAGRISRPSCTCRSTTRCAASRARCGSAPTRPARPATARARRPAPRPRRVPECHGSGSIAVDQGPFSFSQVCPTCGGRGQVIPTPCPTCRGPGRRDARTRGEGARARRRHRRSAHPREGSRRGRRERRAGRRSVRRRARAVAPAVRAQRQRPHDPAAGHVRGGDARRRREGPDARRSGHDADPAGHAERQGDARARPGRRGRCPEGRRAEDPKHTRAATSS